MNTENVNQPAAPVEAPDCGCCALADGSASGLREMGAKIIEAVMDGETRPLAIAALACESAALVEAATRDSHGGAELEPSASENDEDAFNDWNRDITEFTPSLWDAYYFGLKRGRNELKDARAENDFLRDALSGFEWQRINAMSQAEVEKELLDAGYTRERLDAGLAKIRATIAAAVAKRAPNVKVSDAPDSAAPNRE